MRRLLRRYCTQAPRRLRRASRPRRASRWPSPSPSRRAWRGRSRRPQSRGDRQKARGRRKACRGEASARPAQESRAREARQEREEEKDSQRVRHRHRNPTEEKPEAPPARGTERIRRRGAEAADRVRKRAVGEIRDIDGSGNLDCGHCRRVGGEKRGDARGQEEYPEPASGDKPQHQRGGAGLAVRERRRDGAGQIRSGLYDQRQRSDDVCCQHTAFFAPTE